MVVDAAACISIGECVVLTKTMLNVFYGLMVTGGIMLIIVVLLFLFTPAATFLRAKFKKMPVLLNANRGQQGQFNVPKEINQGVMDIKKQGSYIISENSHIIEKKSGVPIYLAFGEFGATLPLNYAYAVQQIRESGRKITNIEDLGEYVGVRWNDVSKSWEKIPEEEKKIDNDDFEAKIKPYRTIKIWDLANMFPFNITPALIESKVEHKIALRMSMLNKMNMQNVLMFIMIMMGGTLAAVIAWKFMGGQGGPDIQQVATSAGSSIGLSG